MKTAQKGFTLAELLIALALLGIIAAFTIPKVLQATGNQEATAKIRETISTMEQAYYNLAMQNQLTIGSTLYDNIAPNMNSADQGAAAVPASVLAATHPCVVAPLSAGGNGWIQFQNGAVITGLASGVVLDALAFNNAAHGPAANYRLCIDFNGDANPNQFGQDVFVGNFNQFGGFAAVPTNQNQKSFNWGNTTTNVFDTAGAALGGANGPGDSAGTAPAYAGMRLID